MIGSGAFDAVNLNFNFGDWGSTEKVIPAAKEAGMAIFVREAFMKGPLFKMGSEAGIDDRRGLARAALRWSLSHDEVTSLTIGTGNPDHLRRNLAVIDDVEMSDEDRAIIDRVRADSPTFREFEELKKREFFDG